MKPSKTEIRIGLYIKHLRQERNHKQIILALALNISHSKYSKIETGKIGFSFEFLEKNSCILQSVFCGNHAAVRNQLLVK